MDDSGGRDGAIHERLLDQRASRLYPPRNSISTAMDISHWKDASTLPSPGLAPWRFTDDTEFSGSDSFSLRDNKVVGKLLAEAGADTETLIKEERVDPNLDDRSAFVATFEHLIHFCEEFIDHEGEVGGRFAAVYTELAENIEEGYFAATNMLCYEEDSLIDVIISSGKVVYWVHENPNYDPADEGDE